MKRLVFCSLMIGLALLSGCAQPPIVELNAAQKAIQKARLAQSEKYAAEDFGAAQKALNDATAEITKQDKRFVLARNYTTTRNLLHSVGITAQAAQTAAKTNKEKTKSEVEALIQDTTASLKATKVVMETKKDTKTNFASLKVDLDTLTARLDEARALANKGDYLEAMTSVNHTKQKVTDIAAELQQATQKVKGKRTS